MEIVTWGDKEVEAADLARRIQKKRKEQRCAWSDFAVLYRQHNHRDELVKELAERGIPFSIEGLDVLDTPEVRDVVACLTAAVTPNDAASLFRVAALPQFGIDPTGAARSDASGACARSSISARCWRNLPNGAAVLASVEKAHAEVEKEGVRADGCGECRDPPFRVAAARRRSARSSKFVEALAEESDQPKPEAPPNFSNTSTTFGQARGSDPAAAAAPTMRVQPSDRACRQGT